MATFWVNIAGARGATLIDIYIFIGGSGRGAAGNCFTCVRAKGAPRINETQSTVCCAEHREPNSIGLRFLQQAVLQGTVALHHVSTTDQLADLFTKPLDPVHSFQGPNDGKYQRILAGYRIREIAGES